MGTKILIFGDSITHGVFAKKCWTRLLQDFVEPQETYNLVYNLGIPGDTSTKLLARFENEFTARFKAHRPKNRYIVIFAIGINDVRIWPGTQEPETSTKEFQSNLKKLFTKAKSKAHNVYCVGLTPIDESKTTPFEGEVIFSAKLVQEYDEIIQTFCTGNNIPYINLRDSINSNMLLDGVHPNEQGHRIIFEKVKETLN